MNQRDQPLLGSSISRFDGRSVLSLLAAGMQCILVQAGGVQEYQNGNPGNQNSPLGAS